MAQEQYFNFANSTAAGAINNSSNPVTFSVQPGDGALFPATTNGPFEVTVSNADGTNAEAMLCTSRTGDALTCARGAGATLELPTPTLLAHASGSVVSGNISTGAMNRIRGNIHATYSGAVPTATRLGDQLFPSDDVVSLLDNGSGPQSNDWHLPSLFNANPNLQTWSWINQSGASVASTPNSIFLTGTANAGSGIQARVATLPAAPYKIRLTCVPILNINSFCVAGLCLTDGTKFVDIVMQNDHDTSGAPGLVRITADHWNTPTSFNAEITSKRMLGFATACAPIVFQFQDDGVNRIISFCPDGVTPFVIATEGNTNFLTPTEFGFYYNDNTANIGGGILVLGVRIG